MRAATFDSSFWVHAVYLELVEFLLADFALMCTKAVENELGRDNPTSRRLKELLADKSIKRAAAPQSINKGSSLELTSYTLSWYWLDHVASIADPVSQCGVSRHEPGCSKTGDVCGRR